MKKKTIIPPGHIICPSRLNNGRVNYTPPLAESRFLNSYQSGRFVRRVHASDVYNE